MKITEYDILSEKIARGHNKRRRDSVARAICLADGRKNPDVIYLSKQGVRRLGLEDYYKHADAAIEAIENAERNKSWLI